MRASRRNDNRFPDPSRVITPKEASKLLGTAAVFVDTRNYWKYAKGHIPGAVNLELYAFHWVDTSAKGLAAFRNQMVGLLGSYGIRNSSEVVFYQNNSGYDAARGVWLLNYLGNKNAKMIDGGLNAWRRMKLPTSTRDPAIKATEFSPRPDQGAVATLDFLLPAVIQGRRKLRLLDARSEGEYNGKFRRARKAGHMPESVNVDWRRALRKDGTLRDARTLARLYAGGGFDKSQEVVTYCQSGYRAAHTWLVLKLLGYRNVRNYIGSWYEWGGHRRTPVVKG